LFEPWTTSVSTSSTTSKNIMPRRTRTCRPVRETCCATTSTRANSDSRRAKVSMPIIPRRKRRTDFGRTVARPASSYGPGLPHLLHDEPKRDDAEARDRLPETYCVSTEYPPTRRKRFAADRFQTSTCSLHLRRRTNQLGSR